MAQLINLFNPEQILVAHELHANGTSHLHAYVKCKGPYRTDNSRFADIKDVDGRVYHGNYQGCRSAKNVIKYCSKDEDYVSNFDVAPLLAKRSNRREHMESLLLGKRTLEELLVDEPQYLYNYQSLFNSLKAYKETQAQQYDPLPPFLPNPWCKILLVSQQDVKRRHYHIFSSGPNSGKTTWAKSLCKQYGGIISSNKEPYWNVKPGIRFIILDEYNTARFRYDELNAMADGTYSYRRFGTGIYQFPEESKPIIIILSNVELSTLYPFMCNLVYARFKVIDVSSYKFI